jgi:excisionase family DNA binding protein
MSAHENKRSRQSAVYTVAELAARLKVSRQHILNAIEQGELNAVNIGNNKTHFWRVPISEVERYEASRNSNKGGKL